MLSLTNATLDYWRLTGNYCSLLKLTSDYWRLLAKKNFSVLCAFIAGFIASAIVPLLCPGNFSMLPMPLFSTEDSLVLGVTISCIPEC